MPLIKMQIGKNGLTDEFIKELKKRFEESWDARITLLKSSTRDKKEVKEWDKKILSSLGKNYTSRVIGYTISIKKWRKARKAEE